MSLYNIKTVCHVQFCTQLTKAYVAETSCNQLLIDTATYVIVHNQFAYVHGRA